MYIKTKALVSPANWRELNLSLKVKGDEMTREEHLAWCKERALEYVDRNDLDNALVSMLSDLGKHEETENHIAIQLGVMMQMGGQLGTSEQMRKFIEGFNS